MEPHKLSDMVENHMVRGNLMERFPDENHTKVVGDLKVKLTITKESLTKEHKIMKTLVKEQDGMKDTYKKVTSEAKIHALSKKTLKESLKAAYHSQKKLEKEFSTLKDKLVDTFDHYFERAKDLVAFLYPN